MKDQHLEDVDRQIAKLKALMRGEEQKVVSAFIDKAYFDQIIADMKSRMEKMK